MTLFANTAPFLTGLQATGTVVFDATASAGSDAALVGAMLEAPQALNDEERVRAAFLMGKMGLGWDPVADAKRFADRGEAAVVLTASGRRPDAVYAGLGPAVVSSGRGGASQDRRLTAADATGGTAGGQNDAEDLRQLREATATLLQKGLDSSVYQAAARAIIAIARNRSDLIDPSVLAALKEIFLREGLDSPAYTAAARAIEVIAENRSDLADPSLAVLKEILLREGLDSSVYQAAARAIGTIARNRIDLVDPSVLAALKEILLRKGLDSSAYKAAAWAIVAIAQNRSDLIDRSVLAALKEILLREGLDSFAYTVAARAIGDIAQNRSDLIDPSVLDALKETLRREGLDSYVYETASEAIGVIFGKSGEALPPSSLSALQLRQIRFSDGGNASHDVSSFVESLLRSAPSPSLQPLPPEAADTFPRKEAVTLREIEADSEDDKALQALLQDYTFERTMGRTLVFRHKTSGEYLALKLLKEEEDPGELFHEHRMLEWIGKWKKELGLQSDYPTPVAINAKGVVRVAQTLLPGVSETFTDKSGREVSVYNRSGSYILTAYETGSAGYFTYLNDASLSPEAFREGMGKSLHDLFTLARHGIIHTALSDLFHNVAQRGRGDRGKYLWMVDVIRAIGRSGSGRVHAWLESVAYPNLRLSGLADLAEAAALEEMVGDEQHPASIHLGEARKKFADAGVLRKVFLANFLGDYFFTFGLIAGSRLFHRGEWSEEDRTELGEMMRDTFESSWRVFVSGGEAGENGSPAGAVDWKRMARQMAYYMSGAYVEDFRPGLGEDRKAPDGMYDPSAQVAFGDFREGSWSKKIGWTGLLNHGGTDGQRALGPVNGAYPITEEIKAIYLYTALMAAGRRVGGG
ncbi:MAG: hypothetical protein HY466_04015 [Deltaproteobacteria bacterium]|nr:hypothetical protein [Deltaproteobacteria bacterium]